MTVQDLFRQASDESRASESRQPKRLLICVDWFVPGFRAGGPITSCANLVTLLAGDATIQVVTSNRDLGASQPYAGLPPNAWLAGPVGEQIFYASSSLRRMRATRHELATQPETIYLNGMFSLAGTLWPLVRTQRLSPRTRIVLAPRGMLKSSALRQKGWKKWPLLYWLHRRGWMRSVQFHATSPDELTEIEAVFGQVPAKLIPNVPRRPAAVVPQSKRTTGLVKLCLVGRVHPIKNVLWLIEALRSLPVPCELEIVGPIEDRNYYEQCRAATARLPAHVTVRFLGGQKEPELSAMVASADAMILPTQGENFGHAIFESLAVGTPVIISDRTRWRNLVRQQAGWDLDLNCPQAFREAITSIARMDEQAHQQWRCGALRLASQFFDAQSLRQDYLDLFFG